jgi:hypothetical protein
MWPLKTKLKKYQQIKASKFKSMILHTSLLRNIRNMFILLDFHKEYVTMLDSHIDFYRFL